METILLFVGVLVLIGILLVPVSQRLGAPILLLILIIGMLVGEDGPGQVKFNDFSAAYALGSLALSIILFAGGLETDVRKTRGARAPSILMATLGVVITAIIVGGVAAWALKVPLEYGMLIGAVVASTDATATFLLIQQSRIGISDKVKNTLVLESGLNDPIAIFLTIMITTMVNTGTVISVDSLLSSLPLLISQLGLGLVLGGIGGWLSYKLIDRVTLPDGLYPPLALACGIIVYSLTALLGGSGFLAIYLCGLVIAGKLEKKIDRILHFSEALQWLSQITLFLMLGLLVTPSGLFEILPQAIIIAAALMFVARPIAVLLCAAPFGFRFKESVFLGWVGLRGAVPIFLVIYPVITPGPITVQFFNIVFVIVVASLLFQGSTVSFLARRLGLLGQHGLATSDNVTVT